ncbi:MAG: AMP-dependent synthetase/ligase [Anaerovoracaceae bacterium]|jgi:long-chain acyl-CoA synthetase
MMEDGKYRDPKEQDRAYADSIIAAIEADDRPGVMYKESRPITDVKDMIESSAELFGDNVAFYQKYARGGHYETITYREMLRRVNGLGTYLIGEGFQGERIAVIGPNCSEWAISYLAVLNGTGVVVPLDKELNAEELEQLVIKADVSCVIYKGKKLGEVFTKMKDSGHTALRRLIRMDADEWTAAVWRGQEMIEAGDRRFVDAQIDSQAMSILLFTSGTTGVSKGVMLSHRNIAVDLMVSPTVLKVNDWDIFFSVLPLHHTYECTSGFLIPMYKGAAVAYCEGLKYLMKNMQEVRPTMFLGVPAIFETMYRRIWRTVRKAGKEKTLRRAISVNRVLKKLHIDLSSKLFKDVLSVFGGRMRELISGGAAISPEVMEGFRDFGINMLQGYGLTECAPMGALNPDKMPKATSVGYPFPACKVKIIDKDEDGIGEICLWGGNVMLGYYEMPQETAEVLQDGWFHSGDLGYLDEDGYLIITGRKKNVIITKNGKNVFPEELEYYLQEIPLISESMVFSEETSDGSDDTIVAALRLDPEEVQERCGQGTDEAKIEQIVWEEIEKINERQPFWKRIKKIIIRKDDFVKNTSNKIIRFAEGNKKK